jgi:hypothetical protein
LCGSIKVGRGRRVEGKILVEKVAHPLGQLAADLDLLLHDGERGAEIGVVVLVGQDAGPLQDRDGEGLERALFHGAKILAVDPEKLVRVEARVGAVDLRQVELRDHFLDGNDLAIVLGRPAEQAEIITHRGGQITLVDVILDRSAGVALAHLGAVRIEDERDVSVVRRLRAERLDEREMLLRVGKMVFAANDVGDAHLQIIDDVDEVENGRAILALDDEVGFVRAVELDVATNEVVHGNGRLGRAETDRAVRFISLALGHQLLDRLAINPPALALEIGAAIALHPAAELRPLVPVHPEPAQPLQDHVDVLGLVPRGVGVLHAQDERAAGVAGIEPVEKRGAGAADMKHAGGRRRKADTNGFHVLL